MPDLQVQPGSPISSSTRVRAGRFLSEYFQRTREPLYSLLFLLPLVVIYEIGVLTVAPGAPLGRELVAERIIHRSFSWLGISGSWLAGLLLLGSLLFLHLRSGRTWLVHPLVPLGMLIESCILTLPLYVLHGLMLQAGGIGPEAGLRNRLLQTIGAGVYEELLFRLFLVGGLAWLARRFIRQDDPLVTAVISLVGGAIFAACHIQPVGAEAFAALPFFHRWLAGAYLSFIYLKRGLGISTGCHVLHNVVLLLRA